MLADEIKKLEEENLRLLNECSKLRIKNNSLENKVKHYKQCCLMVLPEKVYTHKSRRNTTVKFRDGSCITVKRKQCEKDCLETAIAFCILKQMLSARDVKKLIAEREEH